MNTSFAACAALIVLSSCAKLPPMPTLGDVRGFRLNDLRPAPIAVVEAREGQLKELALGKDKAKAFERSRQRELAMQRQRALGSRNPSVDWNGGRFIDPPLDLPDFAPTELDGSLLPPKSL